MEILTKFSKFINRVLTFYIEGAGISFTKNEMIATPLICIDYAGEDAKLPYRFLVKDVDVMKKLKNPKH